MTPTSPPPIAVVALACRFPDANSPDQLWQNMLEGRRSFRPLPPERLPLADYAAGAITDAETITPVLAGLLTDWQFDRTGFKVPQTAFEAADLAHWLALQVADEAIAQIGQDMLPAVRTGVVVANTLTGEFSRAQMLRLRLPYLMRRLNQGLESRGAGEAERRMAMEALTDALRTDFPTPNEETLAGGLANTIAGRIANYYDLQGGAWTVDGACASSLLAWHDAAGALANGELDAVVAGAVDLSLDPFELVGFSRNGALATEEMRVFDRRSSGFWPGEGCGSAVLMRLEDAGAKNLEPLAILRGWGRSTDGAGGLTRPSVRGQGQALARAYAMAGVDPGALGYIEAHGTGTAVGDPTEIRAIAALLERAGADRRGKPLPVGSIKANFGHTKAAAGFAGMIRAIQALRAGTVPPHVGCWEPAPVFAETGHALTPPMEAIEIGENQRFAGVSGFGFGGINVHMVLEGAAASAQAIPAAVTQPCPQDAEVFFLAAPTAAALAEEAHRLAEHARHWSLADMAAAARETAQNHSHDAEWRAAVIASRPDWLAARFEKLADAALSGQALDDEEIWLGQCPLGTPPPRIGFMFPGQAAPSRTDGGLWRRRFEESRKALLDAELPEGEDSTATHIAQPAITAGSLAAMQVLRRCGVSADVALGHSLGELTALAWAGVVSEEDLLPLAKTRGAVMAKHAVDGGLMLRCVGPLSQAEALAERHELAIACLNGREDIVLAGRPEAVTAAADTAAAAGWDTSVLRVSHAFHSPDMAPAEKPFAGALAQFSFAAPNRSVVSTVTGAVLNSSDRVPDLLTRQLQSSVRFTEALTAANADLLIEVGPGTGLTRLARQEEYSAIATDAHGASVRGLLSVLAEAFVRGVQLQPAALYDDRPIAKASPWERPQMLANPCGLGERSLPLADLAGDEIRDGGMPKEDAGETGIPADLLGLVRAHVASESGLPEDSIAEDAHLLDDLHLNSLAVGRIIGSLGQRLGLPPSAAPTDHANTTVAELVQHLSELVSAGVTASSVDQYDGVASWLAPYRFGWREAVPPRIGLAVDWSTQGHVVDLPSDFQPTSANLLALWRELQGAVSDGKRHLAILHHGAPVFALARTLFEEKLFDTVVLVEGGTDAGRAPILGGPPRGFSAWRVEADASLRQPIFERVEPASRPDAAVPTANDVFLVTGGGRGIGAECALALAKKTGAALLLVGRSEANHREVTATLTRAAADGLRARYVQADGTDAAALTAAVESAADWGPVTGIVHAAGLNQPAMFRDLTEQDLEQTLAPKLDGLRAAFAAVDENDLRWAVTFGSIIGRLGLAGEAHYALANAAQSDLLERLAPDHTRIHALEWSVWAGAGMGERLGTLEHLAAKGVMALSLDDALQAFVSVLTEPSIPDGPIVLTSRFGPPEGVELGGQPPNLRFLDRVRVFYPNQEIVADSDLRSATDLYLADHSLDGLAVMPGVMLLEAMQQAAIAIGGAAASGMLIDEVAFDAAVTVGAGEATEMRVAALRRDDGRIDATIRSAADGFHRVCARASFHLDAASSDIPEAPLIDLPNPLATEQLYARFLFQAGRFRRLSGYSHLSARRMAATLHLPEPQPWFGGYLSGELLLGDPGARDAGLHALQACVPHQRVLPVSVSSIYIADAEAERASVEAWEVSADGQSYTFDIVWRDRTSRPVEVWRNAKFRRVADLPLSELPAELVPVCIERIVANAVGADLSVMAADRGQGEAKQALLRRAGVQDRLHRGDGKPVLPGLAAPMLSFSDAGDFVLAVTSESPHLACDLEPLTARPWGVDGPNGDGRLIEAVAAAWHENSELAALRVWCARECLRKAGYPPHQPLTIADGADGSLVFAADKSRVVTMTFSEHMTAVLAEVPA